MKAGGTRGTVFEPSTARRIVRAVQLVEGSGNSQRPAHVTSAGDDSDAVLCKCGNLGWEKNSWANLDIYAGQPGSEVDTGVNLMAYNRYANITGSKWCTVMLHRHGYYYLISAECT